MAIPSSGAVSLSDIRSEFGGSGPISMADLYRGGSVIPNNYTNTSSVPTSGALDLTDFRGLKVEGTAREKVARFQAYRHSGLSYYSQESSPTGVKLTSDLKEWNRAINRYQTSDTLAAPALSRSSQKGDSKWTSLIGAAAGVGANVNNSSINRGSHYTSNDSSANNECIQINHWNVIHRDISSSINFTHYFTNQNKCSPSVLFLVPGKWTIHSTTTARTFTLPSGYMAVNAYERGGDGPAGGSGGFGASASPSSGFTSTRYVAWWYNNCGLQLMGNNSASSQTITLSLDISEDITFILREIM